MPRYLRVQLIRVLDFVDANGLESRSDQNFTSCVSAIDFVRQEANVSCNESLVCCFAYMSLFEIFTRNK